MCKRVSIFFNHVRSKETLCTVLGKLLLFVSITSSSATIGVEHQHLNTVHKLSKERIIRHSANVYEPASTPVTGTRDTSIC